MRGQENQPEVEADKTILLVDDDELIIKSLVRLLRKDGYSILTAHSGQQGLDILSRNAVGVILSDQRMEEMSGIEFLSQVKQLYPDTIRMVLSGFTELKSVTEAINQGAIYKFLTKPWDDDLLRENIRKAFSHYRLAAENKRLNDELARLNAILEKRVADQNRESKIESRVLRITQEVMNQQPVGVLGVSNENIIVVANNKAHDLLSVPPGSLVSMNIHHIISGEILDCYENIIRENIEEVVECVDPDTRMFIKRVNLVDGASGIVVTIIPVGF